MYANVSAVFKKNKEIRNSTKVKYCSTGFQQMGTLRVLSIESKVTKFCITQGFTLGVEELKIYITI